MIEAIDRVQKEGRALAVYDLAKAMEQAQEGIDFAKQSKSAMAFIQGCTLNAKLAGLLVERFQEIPIDLSGALAEA